MANHVLEFLNLQIMYEVHSNVGAHRDDGTCNAKASFVACQGSCSHT